MSAQRKAHGAGSGSINRFSRQFPVSCHNLCIWVTITVLRTGAEHHPTRRHLADKGVGRRAAAAMVRSQQQRGRLQLRQHLILTGAPYITRQQDTALPRAYLQQTGTIIGRSVRHTVTGE